MDTKVQNVKTKINKDKLDELGINGKDLFPAKTKKFEEMVARIGEDKFSKFVKKNKTIKQQ